MPALDLSAQEGNDGVVYLKEDDPKAAAGLIEFLYTFDYSADGPAMIFDIHMFIIADKASSSQLWTA